MDILSVFSPTEPINVTNIIFMALGGLGIFLFGLSIMSDSMKSLAGERLKVLVKKTTDATWKGILVGIAITCLIQSSSATTVIVVGLICAGLMTLPQAAGVMLGANIGTTITAFIIGLDIADYALPIIFIGSVLVVFVNRRKLNISGMALLGFGMLFLGLEFMSVGLKELANFSFFETMITTLSSHWSLGVLTGTALTALIQSSSAFVGIIQSLYAGGAIPIKAILPLVLGANIGTTVTALIASSSGNRESKQAAVANLIFKTIGVVLFLIFIVPLTSLLTMMESALGQNNMFTIAIIHTIYNVVTTLVVWALLKPLLKLVKKIIPDTKDGSITISAYHLNEELLESSPVLALESAKLSIVDMGEQVINMVKLCYDYFNQKDDSLFNQSIALEDTVDMYDHLIHDYLIKLHAEHLSTKDSVEQAVYLDAIRDLERIGDHATNLMEFFKERYDNNIETSEELKTSIDYFINIILEQVTNSIQAFSKKDVALASNIINVEAEVDNIEKRYRKLQFDMINRGTLLNEDIHYVDVLSNLERISDHCCNIAENIIDPYYMSH